ncbi:phosphatase PAP2 family protein [Streptomyces sp. NPDC012888]|uniref:phosphatase PAP2 family protein n=1 Tax=Streptomyces sp. NPDC012888 TaxID=3364855 RepID=UPI00367D92A0
MSVGSGRGGCGAARVCGAGRGAAERLLAWDRALTRRAASWQGVWATKVLPAVEGSAEHTKLWLGTAALLALAGGARGRRAALAGVAGMWTGQVFGGAAKHLWDRRRPPERLVPHDRVEERPDSSSFPSGHTAAAVAFTASVVPVWPAVGLGCAAAAAAIAVERVHSGAHYPSDVAAGAVVGLAGARLARRALACRPGRAPVRRVTLRVPVPGRVLMPCGPARTGRCRGFPGRAWRRDT